MVITTLRTDDNMPTNAEITAMVKDPMQWIVDYKEGNNFRHCTTDYSDYTGILTVVNILLRKYI